MLFANQPSSTSPILKSIKSPDESLALVALVSSSVTNDEKPFKKIGQDFKNALQKARSDKKMTQKQLAQKLNVTQAVIAGYENGKEIPNGQLISRMNLILGIKLPKCK